MTDLFPLIWLAGMPVTWVALLVVSRTTWLKLSCTSATILATVWPALVFVGIVAAVGFAFDSFWCWATRQPGREFDE